MSPFPPILPVSPKSRKRIVPRIPQMERCWCDTCGREGWLGFHWTMGHVVRAVRKRPTKRDR